jgi:HSP20 family molecular chaperone IbpA
MRYSYFETWDKDTHYEAEIAIPGFKKSDIKISATQYFLKIDAKNEKRSFTEKINLANKVDIQNISSKLEDGILTITLPKKSSETNAVLVDIQ